MKTLHLRNVPDDVVRRLMGALPDLDIDVRTIADDLAGEQASPSCRGSHAGR